jgi:hypothetical protein
MSVRRALMHVFLALCGALVAAVTVFTVSGESRPARTTGTRPELPELDPPIKSERVRQEGDSVVLAWTPGRLPTGARRTVEELNGVHRTTVVKAGLDWILRSRAHDGSVLDPPRPGLRIPFEVAAINPREYARFVPESERDVVASLRPGQALLARTSAELRGADVGTRLRLAQRQLRVSAIVSDITTNGYEALVSLPPPRSWVRVDEFMLASGGPNARPRIDRRLRSLLGPGRQLRTRTAGEQPFLRYGDAVHPQMIIKEQFGEFSARPLPDGTIEVDQRWLSDNIRRAPVPLIGEVTCHRAVIPQLRSALHEIKNKGLGDLVDGYAGCFGPRFISRDPNGRLSHHAWGIAVDLNAASNQFGAEPNMSPRMVAIMESHGFTWGGRWLLPDGMHFEWAEFP